MKLFDNEQKLKKNLDSLQSQLENMSIYKDSVSQKRNFSLSPTIKSKNLNIKTENLFRSPLVERNIKSDDEDDFNYKLPKLKKENPFKSFEDEGNENYDDDEDYQDANDINDYSFNLDAIPKLPKMSFMTNNFGTQAMETYQQQQTVTFHRLEILHKELENKPKDNVRHPDPSGLKINLMPHQQYALAWLKWREEGKKPKGGILGKFVK